MLPTSGPTAVSAGRRFAASSTKERNEKRSVRTTRGVHRCSSGGATAQRRSAERERLLDDRPVDELRELLAAAPLAVADLRDPVLLDVEHVEHVGDDVHRELHLGPAPL